VKIIARTFQSIILIGAALQLSVFPEPIFAADPYAEAARELAGKIMNSIGPLEEIGFTFQSRASLATKEAATARQAIENELRTRGVKFARDLQSMPKISITLSETIQQYVWIAEIRRDPGYQVVMTIQARTQDATSKDSVLRMVIQSRLLYEQNDPILDVKLLGDGMLVLDPKRLGLFRRQNDQWLLVNSAPLKSAHPFPRDIRGRLSEPVEAIQAHLPGLSCNGTIKPALDLNCSQDETRWPLDLGGITPAFSKNYFTPENMPAFFSAASIEDDGAELLVLAGIDGRTYLFDKTAGQAGLLDGWGSDIAAVDSGCGARRQIFATLVTDPLERGAIQAFEIVHRKTVATSSTVEFPGPITALWPVSSQNAAIAVSRNIKTGRYAAFHLSIACSR
jgi:hypothetical protein